jgi:hypothetical protein
MDRDHARNAGLFHGRRHAGIGQGEYCKRFHPSIEILDFTLWQGMGLEQQKLLFLDARDGQRHVTHWDHDNMQCTGM